MCAFDLLVICYYWIYILGPQEPIILHIIIRT